MSGIKKSFGYFSLNIRKMKPFVLFFDSWFHTLIILTHRTRAFRSKKSTWVLISTKETSAAVFLYTKTHRNPGFTSLRMLLTAEYPCLRNLFLSGATLLTFFEAENEKRLFELADRPFNRKRLKSLLFQTEPFLNMSLNKDLLILRCEGSIIQAQKPR